MQNYSSFNWISITASLVAIFAIMIMPAVWSISTAPKYSDRW